VNKIAAIAALFVKWTLLHAYSRTAATPNKNFI